MRAELAAIEDRPERRRFVLSCTRAVLTSGTVLRALIAHVFLLGFVAATVLRAVQLPVGVRTEAVVLVSLVAALAWWGRHVAPLGPVCTDRSARLVRLAGYAAVMTTTTLLLSVGTDDPAGWWLAPLAISLYLVGLLRATAATVAGQLLSLPTAGILALSGLVVWWIPMLLLRASVFLAFVVALGVIGAGSALGSRAGTPTKGVISGLAAATAMFLLIFLAAALTYRLSPGLAPDVSPPALDPAARAANNRAESLDPYVADYLMGALFSAVLTFLSARLLPDLSAARCRCPRPDRA